ncbi:DENN domain-containing protein 1C [Discoglossus pictus]
MGSRLKENPERIFDGFFEVLCPPSLDKDPILKIQFPTHFDDQDSVTMLTKFCFPIDVERWENPSVQHFSFTLTDLQGYQSFGFCRLSIQARCCICILSSLPWFELFYKFLNNIAEYLAKDQFNETTELLQSVYQHPVPETNTSLNVETLSYFIAPDPVRLPSVPENRNLTEFMVAVHADTMLQLYSSLLFERRILIISSKLSTLTACVHASAALLYPMYWQHIYIPTLPPHLLDYCSAPMPYLIGVHSSLLEQVGIKSLEDVVIFNVDTNSLETPFQDLQSLPPHVVSLLKIHLRKQTALMGDGVSRAFLGAQALLFGGYRDALICTPGEPISFCQESFLNHKDTAMRHFLQSAVHLQLFTQFIDIRLEKLNAGAGFTDVFEQEITNCGLSGNSKSYQLWLENLKKNVKSRTHPTVKNMLKYAKGQARTGLQGMRSRMKQKDLRQLQRAGSLKADGGPTESHERLQSRRPITQHFGQSRPRRPGKKYIEGDSWDSQGDTPEKEDKAVESVVEDDDDEFSLLETESMDLLEDIFETLNTRAPDEERALYGTHSLDFFNLDDNQYFTRFQSINSPSDENLSLSLSQPRNSDLWYLEEEEEESQEYTSMSPTSLTPEVTSLTSEVTAPTIEVTSVMEEDTLQTEVTSVTPNVCSLTTNVALSSSEVTALTTQCKILPPKEEKNEATLGTERVAESDTSTDPSPKCPNSNTRDKLGGWETSSSISLGSLYPSVRTAISRFQSGTLDPRLMWTGTNKDSAQTERVKRLREQLCSNSVVANSQNPLTHKHSTQTPTTPSKSSSITHSGNDSNTRPDQFRYDPDQGTSPKPADVSPPSLPKVSELKKRFESSDLK